jgi:hypothetical protein
MQIEWSTIQVKDIITALIAVCGLGLGMYNVFIARKREKSHFTVEPTLDEMACSMKMKILNSGTHKAHLDRIYIEYVSKADNRAYSEVLRKSESVEAGNPTWFHTEKQYLCDKIITNVYVVDVKDNRWDLSRADRRVLRESTKALGAMPAVAAEGCEHATPARS